MKITRRVFTTKVLAMTAVVPILAKSEGNSYKIKYDGGSLQGAKAGNDMKLFLEGNTIRLVEKKEDRLNIPAGSITEISYGQDVHRRVGAAIGVALVSFGIGALLALAKSKKHFVGITWADGEKKGGIAFQADKNDYRGLIAGLEGLTGKKAVNTDAMTVKN
jgi:hypothetical protein